MRTLTLLLLLVGTVAAAEPVDVRIPATGEPVVAVTAEVAESAAQRREGLMHRRELAEDRGMLFVYEPPRSVSMWMANTHIPLDMVFIDPDCRVLRVERGAEPGDRTSIPAGGETALVLEVNAGVAAEVEPGMAVAAPPWCPPE
ncbi:MAG: DUF192 domain-containing protein [Thiohalospira sp.]